jgi:hypothetical protein
MNVDQILEEITLPLRLFAREWPNLSMPRNPYFSASCPAGVSYCDVAVTLNVTRYEGWSLVTAEAFYQELRKLVGRGFQGLRIEPSPPRKNWRADGYAYGRNYSGGTSTERIVLYQNDMSWELKYRLNLTEGNPSRVAVDLRGNLRIGT